MGFLDSVLKVFVGDKAKQDVKAIMPIVEQVKSHEKAMEALSIDELRNKTVAFKAKIEDALKDINAEKESLKSEADASTDIDRNEDIYAQIDALDEKAYQITEGILNDILPEAFAVVKETAKRFCHNEEIEVTATPFDRELSAEKDYVTLSGEEKAIWKNSWDAAGKQVTWDMIHYDVQLIGGVAMHQGKIAEMQTGEGKTLVATLPVYLNALSGKGVHLVTVNDYLAKRDSAWMAPIFQFHGMSVDCIDYHRPNSAARRKAYNADITYGTNNEFGFDYLRDNMSHSPNDLVQRKHNYAIVDEVDSVLVDDARTPLIISGPIPKGDIHEFEELKPQISSVVEVQRKYLVGVLAEAKKLIAEGDLKEGGFKLLRVYRGLPKNKALIKYLSEEGIKQLLQKTENQYMQDNNREMPKVDAELYFVIEEKNNQIELTDKGVDFLSGKENPDFFVMPEMGMEISKIEALGLSKEEEAEKKEELFREFSVKSERIHTMRQLLKAYTLFEKDTEYVVMDNKVKIVDEQTGRIMDGRRYSDGLHQAIEAKESVKIEDATQTFATITLQNFFRMYSKLSGMTGTAVTEAGEFWEIYELDVVEIPTNRPIARHDQEDMVYKTKREKYNAVIDHVTDLSRAGRPVLIGTTSVEISELLSRMLKIRQVPHNVLNAKLHKKEADVVEEAGKAGQVTIATNMAGRGTDIKLSKEVKDAGGLAIIGTERHDSRRVDRQLRGRSGRQGDPGSSQFYVSLEDNLMRLFGSERIAKLMDRMGLEEGEVIQHSMISKSIERAQKKVEENNFGTRKRLLEYDDIMNAQREVVYKRRYHALYGERLKVDIANMIFDTSESITESNKMANDFKNFEFELIRYFSMSSPVTQAEFEKKDSKKIAQQVYEAAYKHYQQKMEIAAEQAFPVIKQVYERPDNKFERIAVPFTDGTKTLQVATDLEKAYETEGKQLINDFEKNISLAIIDDAWKTHLRKMDELKQSVQLAVHEQKDPLLIYKFEAFELFKVMIDQVNRDVISFLFKGEIPQQNAQISEAKQQKREKVETQKEEIQNMDERAAEARKAGQTQSKQDVIETIIRERPKIGRNDKVTIKNVMSGENKSMKYKQAIPLLDKGDWVLVED
ncbi:MULTISPECIES: preprotein translocase subunit SecA [Croceibacter]|jgi:preprotein translocase subunit SecA|uniref:Protein translocase subunit SecA n=1 Tax=Croceibacter atlanticus (strain ATCC BAA-628 / JCM 21780 / CIP 108009 / IAM 15332 / KCTC 12090 / HTCC2559) TaxID=216432 RepID=A3UC28_CROAH|nr:MULTISPECIES: preprotein translocase subunit SecA [Croceibacter]EAP86179.1 translocase [Croceibacter atlanticus HTCC2559]MBG24774.1 preprotein translocase subunit SecA [Croceibacter sp.]MBW4968959.1 preprotein translocase subunit SecA [Croceibacter atlanticus]HAT70554.1 preprotein translocase subunit SecA [Flavobacteriaceae bacterium]|tara:strand:+ start:2088 stop:5441 length:3354 start_codon:yes stop_codon:yes gene_type:complete